jgi:hypothetical protein
LFAMAFDVQRGSFDELALDGRRFIIVGHTPGNMGEGNWSVGLIVDEETDSRQQEALAAIVGGQVGGPMANIAPLVGEFLGVESKPIRFEGSGGSWSVSAGAALDQAVEGASGLGGEQLYLENAGHPASNRLGLATAKRSHLHAFGFDWDQEDGRNNGHFAPFDWRG